MDTNTPKESTYTQEDHNNNNSNSNKELVEYKGVEDTPFTAVRVGEKWFLVMGKYRLTEELETLEDCIHAAQEATWNRILTVIQVLIEENEEHKKQKQQNNTNVN